MGMPRKSAMAGLKAHNFIGWAGLIPLLLKRLTQLWRYHFKTAQTPG
jgi:hypothetical protein